jgi:hypothetical protein
MKTSLLSCLALSGLMLSLAVPEPENLDRPLVIMSCSTFFLVLTSDDANCKDTQGGLDELAHLIGEDLNKVETGTDGGYTIKLFENGPKSRGLRASRRGKKLTGNRGVNYACGEDCRPHDIGSDTRRLTNGLPQAFSDPQFQSTLNTDMMESSKFCATGFQID